MMLTKKKALQVKMEILSQGISFDIDLFKHYDGEFYDNQFVYGQTSKDITPKHRFPQVILLTPEVNSALLRRDRSPYHLEREDRQFMLYREDELITDIGLPERPAYFGRVLSDGTPIENILAVAGESTPGFFLSPDCYYFRNGKPCAFCSMKGTRSTVGKHMATTFSPDQIRECIAIVENTKWRDVSIYSITTGTCETDEQFVEEIIRPLEVMRKAMEKPTNIHLLTHPPKEKELLYRLKEAGVTSIAFNLEVYDRNLMHIICPGKFDCFGYDEWWSALENAHEIWGDWQVFCGLVWGLEPKESTIRGNHEIASRGISVASNIFHADPHSVMRDHPHLPSEHIRIISQDLAELYAKYPQMKTIFDVSMRSTIDWEIKQGYLG